MTGLRTTISVCQLLSARTPAWATHHEERLLLTLLLLLFYYSCFFHKKKNATVAIPAEYITQIL